ncbi:hypothetical protein GCK72_017015 [Caenorhabditis remanei]|uniref:mitogen-activated protein kinase kinase n=1 Tax=Caenorhabditis remanei TaxID=31234 RepID=A0A6A5G724_CAERE|nr:hypothetical protein GCK72_017015 [Caenorhabditis remanei]KAF1750465.1 hypothetical protein GCK72_017015 [Caenorhabditis remanei]
MHPDTEKIEQILETIQEASGVLTINDARQTVDFEKLTKEDKIGEGRFGSVYRYAFKSTTMAVKTIETARKTLIQMKQVNFEVECLEKFRGHKNIVEMFGVFMENKTIYICLELLLIDIYQLMSIHKVLPSRAALFIIRETLSALQYIHQKEVIHGDLSPHNVMIRSNGEVVLCDFGLAKNLKAIENHLSTANPLFMAPEILGANPMYSPKADVWGIGVLLHFMLTAEIPYGGSTNEFFIYSEILDERKPVLDRSFFHSNLVEFASSFMHFKVTNRPSAEEARKHPLLNNTTIEELRRLLLTLPSNTTDKGAVPILNWAESMRIRLNKLRTKSQKAMDEALRENQTEEEMSRTIDALSEVAGVYNEMFRASNMKCRLNAVFDKRGMFEDVEAAIHAHEFHDPHSHGLFDRMQQSMNERTAIERNILAVTDTFKQNPVSSPRGSRLSAPPPIKFGKHFEEANKGLVLAMDAVFNRTRGEAMSWKFKRISHRSFRNSKTLVEVQYCTVPATEKEFVSCMKALLVLNFGILEDLILGGEDESLYDTESIYQSKRKVYREFTKSAREIILCSPVTKFTVPTNVAQVNNYIQMYVNCFSNKCHYCKKYLRNFMPPTMVIRESFVYCHKLCLLSHA